MEHWFSENYENDISFSVKIKKRLFSGISDFQKVEVFDTYGFGRMFALDGRIMLGQKNEFIYHEMITHVPLFVHPEPRNVLVIGGGDGGTVREIVKHETIERVDLVEIDKMVVDKCKEFFPELAHDLDNEKVNVLIEDGINFVKTKKDFYDVIIIDSTDPIGPGEGLFTKEFYEDCKEAMTGLGILVAQTETPYYFPNIVKKLYEKYNSIFENVNIYFASVPVYPSGTWSFCFCSDKLSPLRDFAYEKVEKADFTGALKYYNEDIHQACFAVPNFVKELI